MPIRHTLRTRAALPALATLALLPAAAHADAPRAGYWCGFRAGAHSALPSPPPAPDGFVNRCRAAETVLTPALGANALPSAFILRRRSGHLTLDSFRLGFDARTIFDDDAFGEASDGYAISDNGRTLSGTFTSPTSFAGSYVRGRLSRRYYAWWVGRRCGRYARVFYSRCSG